MANSPEEEFIALRPGSKYHYPGLCDEWPAIKYPFDFEERGYPGVLRPGMTLCVEGCIGAAGGPEGINLDEQVLITDTGHENPFWSPFVPLLMN